MTSTCEADKRRNSTQEHATQNNGGKSSNRKTQKQIDEIRKDIEKRGDNWEEIEENSKRENREGWRFVYNSPPMS